MLFCALLALLPCSLSLSVPEPATGSVVVNCTFGVYAFDVDLGSNSAGGGLVEVCSVDGDEDNAFRLPNLPPLTRTRPTVYHLLRGGSDDGLDAVSPGDRVQLELVQLASEAHAGAFVKPSHATQLFEVADGEPMYKVLRGARTEDMDSLSRPSAHEVASTAAPAGSAAASSESGGVAPHSIDQTSQPLSLEKTSIATEAEARYFLGTRRIRLGSVLVEVNGRAADYAGHSRAQREALAPQQRERESPCRRS